MRILFARLPWQRNKHSTPLSPEAFVTCCQQQTTDLLRLARRLTRGNEDPAQDLVQETLIRALEAFLRDDYRDEGNLRAYLMRILTNRFLSQKRRDKWSAGGDTDTALESLTVDAAEDTALLRTMDEPLECALVALPDSLRAAVLLVDIEGLEYGEAARALGIPLGTVRSRLFRARQLLHQTLLPCAHQHGWLPVQPIQEVSP